MTPFGRMLPAALAWLPVSLAFTTPPHKSPFLSLHTSLPSVDSRSTSQLFNLLDDILDNNPFDNDNNKRNDNPQAQVNSIQTALFDQSDVLIGLEVALEELESVLEKKQSELEAKQDAWSQDKVSLMAQIADLTATLTQSKEDDNQDDDAQETQFEESQSEQDRLKREIDLLKTQQARVSERYVQERTANEALQVKLAKANDSLEFEQMLFFKDRKELQAQVAEQQQQLQDIQNKLSKAETQFGTDQSSLQAQLQAEKEKLQASNKEIRQIQQEYYKGQDLLKEQLRQDERAARDAERALEEERRNQQREKNQLQAQLEQEQTNLAAMEQAIQDETSEFQDEIQPRLEDTFQQEQLKVEQLSRKIQREQDRFEVEKTSLEERIAVERQRLDKVQRQLGQERTQNNQVLTNLKEEQGLLQEQRADDRARMQKRYANLRAAITARIEQEKRQGRTDLRVLQSKYEDTLAETQDAIGQLQDQVQGQLSSNDNLQQLVDDQKRQVQQVYQETKEEEVRYQRLILDRKMEIQSLETDLQQLKETDSERRQELERVEHSYREIAKASLQLTGRRLNRVNPVRLFRNKKP